MKRILITMPEEMLAEVDKIARAEGESRSRFVRRALRARMAEINALAFEALLAEGYVEMHDDLLRLAQAGEHLQAQASEDWVWDE